MKNALLTILIIFWRALAFLPRNIQNVFSQLFGYVFLLIPLKRNNENLVNEAKNIKNILQKLGKGRVMLENSGNIGKSYRRNDEIGTPICITIDFDSLDDQAVTVRDRDTMEQKRINTDELVNYYQEYYGKE